MNYLNFSPAKMQPFQAVIEGKDTEPHISHPSAIRAWLVMKRPSPSSLDDLLDASLLIRMHLVVILRSAVKMIEVSWCGSAVEVDQGIGVVVAVQTCRVVNLYRVDQQPLAFSCNFSDVLEHTPQVLSSTSSSSWASRTASKVPSAP